MIAICFVVHNQLRYTKWFIESIAKNSYPHSLGFFAIDNGSSDGSFGYLQSMQVNPKVVMRNDNNDSLSRCWNRVLREALNAGADVICLANNDIIVGPGWLDAIVAEEKKAEKTYWLPNGAIPFHDFDEGVRSRAKTGRSYHGRGGWCLFFRREAVEEFLPIPEELRLWYGDDYIHWKLGKAGYRGLTVDDCCAHHFGSKTVEIVGGIQSIIDADRLAYNRITGDNL